MNDGDAAADTAARLEALAGAGVAPTTPGPTRQVRGDDRAVRRPRFVVWELTLACDLSCSHCGSRAGSRRPSELTTEECLDVVGQLADLGVREVTLIGGEAYLRKDWLTIVQAIADAGMHCSLQSGARNLTAERIRQAKDAGLSGAAVSIDGLADLHDTIRGFSGSWDRAITALRELAAQGLSGGVNTGISPGILPELRELFEILVDCRVSNWALSPMVAMGRAADNPELLLQPYQLLELFDVLAELDRPALQAGMRIEPANSLGYFGPTEALWRGSGGPELAWTGCPAGQNGMGLESDGTLKGCPSLPTAEYSGGSVRERRIDDMWQTAPELAFNSGRTVDDLWGFCRTCYYAEPCLGGCTWVSHSLFGRPGNNPMCHHRALELRDQGLRERIAPVRSAPGVPFDHGEFELIVEPFDSPDPAPGATTTAVGVATRAPAAAPAPTAFIPVSSVTRRDSGHGRPPAHQRQPERVDGRIPGRIPPPMDVCRSCRRHVHAGTTTCPHCGTDIAESAARHASLERAALDAAADVAAALRRAAVAEPDPV